MIMSSVVGCLIVWQVTSSFINHQLSAAAARSVVVCSTDFVHRCVLIVAKLDDLCGQAKYTCSLVFRFRRLRQSGARETLSPYYRLDGEELFDKSTVCKSEKLTELSLQATCCDEWSLTNLSVSYKVRPDCMQRCQRIWTNSIEEEEDSAQTINQSINQSVIFRVA